MKKTLSDPIVKANRIAAQKEVKNNILREQFINKSEMKIHPLIFRYENGNYNVYIKSKKEFDYFQGILYIDDLSYDFKYIGEKNKERLERVIEALKSI